MHRVHAAKQYDEIREALNSKPLAYSTRGIGSVLAFSCNWRDPELGPFVLVGTVGRDDLWNFAKRQYLQVWKLYCERMNAVFPLDDEFKRQGSSIGQLSHIGIRIHQIDTPSQYPFQIWYQAHEQMGVEDCNYCGDLCFLRLCGYVFWDEPENEIDDRRMDEQIEHLQNISGIHSSELRRHESKETESWAARVEIYKKGGRGYWSEDGMDRIEWTGEFVDEDGVGKLRNDFIDVTIPKEPKEPRRRRYRPATTE